MSEPVAAESEVKPVSPTGAPMLPQVLVVILTVLAVLAGGVAAVGAAGVGLPAWLTGIAAAVSSICAALGIASPGIRKQQ